jgi:anti-sigma factor ChrR (cupin superfamily)
MDEENPATLRAKIGHYRQMLRMVDDPALCEALAVLISVTQEKLAKLTNSKGAANSLSPAEVGAQQSPGTLGDVLYAHCKAPVAERDWEALVRSMAAGDPLALHALYDRAHGIVLAYAMRIAGSRETAEELTIDVFHQLWRQASHFDSRNSTVIAWIMNQTLASGRSSAFRHKLFGSPQGAQPNDSLFPLVASRIAQETGKEAVLPPSQPWSEPEWEQVASGIECKLLATDTERHRVSMLVRLAPGGSYPAHTHAGKEELYLLDGELWIDDRKLLPGDYNYGAPGTGDERVWSETGCTCVLVTSTQDRLH